MIKERSGNDEKYFFYDLGNGNPLGSDPALPCGRGDHFQPPDDHDPATNDNHKPYFDTATNNQANAHRWSTGRQRTDLGL
jgi:hypothetical protein